MGQTLAALLARARNRDRTALQKIEPAFRERPLNVLWAAVMRLALRREAVEGFDVAGRKAERIGLCRTRFSLLHAATG